MTSKGSSHLENYHATGINWLMLRFQRTQAQALQPNQNYGTWLGQTEARLETRIQP